MYLDVTSRGKWAGEPDKVNGVFVVCVLSSTYQSTFQEKEITWTLVQAGDINVEMTRELTIPVDVIFVKQILQSQFLRQNNWAKNA